MQTQEERFLSLAIEAARESVRRGDEPFGAVLVRDRRGRGHGLQRHLHPR